MSDIRSERDLERMISEVELENLKLIFQRDGDILSDEDYARLSALVDNEFKPEETVIDYGDEFAQ